jgi:glycosyltransferase involved in cell wall biosynthesis
MKNLDFSFIIPAHNEEDVILTCIDSIKKQSFKNYEIIVINDGSTDKTKELIEKNKNLNLINLKEGHSAAFARNRGSEKAQGKYLIFLDADQTLEKNFLKKITKMIKERDVDIAAFRVLASSPETIFQKGWHAYRKYNRCAAPIIKRELYKKIKYNETLFFVEDDVIFENFHDAGHTLIESGAIVYHIDPKEWKDYFRQRMWQGRGLVMKIFRLKKYWALRYFIPCLILPLMLINPYILLVYLGVGWLFFVIKSKEIFNSFWWITTDLMGRFISLFYFMVYSLAAIIKGEII